MVYKYFEHEADIGIIGAGKTLEDSFTEAAKGMFKIMANIDKIRPEEEVDIKVKAKNKEELFIEWLNELLAQKDLNEMLFSKFKIKIKKKNDSFILEGKAYGEGLNPDKHELELEVKAASYSQLKVEKKKQYISQCVVDV